MIGKIIKKIRKEKGLTQNELAKIIGISQTTLSGYETGYSNPIYETIKDIANICDYDIKFVKRTKN